MRATMLLKTRAENHFSRSRDTALRYPSFNSTFRYTKPRGSQLKIAEQGTAVTASQPGSLINHLNSLEYEVDSQGRTRAKYQREGWSFWSYEGLKVHFAQAGEQGNPVVLLIHGYGASAYHWRYQYQEMVEAGYHVYAMDLIGFGLSEKAPLDYSNGRVWISQISAFISEVIGGGPVTIVGNSLGAYASLAAASSHPNLIRAVAMLNGAGPFRDSVKSPPPPSSFDPIKQTIQTTIKRVILFFAFIWAKQPIRIKQVLDLVYVNKGQIDEDLISSIEVPALDPDASDVFFRVNNQMGVPVYVDELLDGFKAPLLLLWGDADPWIVPSRAEKVKSVYPAADLRFIPSGHCPHDDTPHLANQELLHWLKSLH